MYYGWQIVGVTFVAQLVATGTIFYSFGFLFLPILEDLQLTRFQMGWPLVAVAILAAGVAPWIGGVVDRGNARRVMAIGAIVHGVGFLLLSRVQSYPQLLLVYAGPLALGMALLGGVVNPTLIARWFVAQRGRALGLSMMGVSFSGVVMSYVVTALITALGWRGAAAALALLPVCVVLPLVLWRVADAPSDLGLHADGGDASPPEPAVDPGVSTALGDVVRVAAFWFVALAFALGFAPNSAVVGQLAPHAEGLGFSKVEAAGAVSLMALMGMLGKPLFGWVGDRFGGRRTLVLCLALQAGGLLLVLAPGSQAMLLLGAGVFGAGFSGLMPLHGLLVAKVFGAAFVGRMLGAMQPVMMPITQGSGLYMGWIHDRTGSYTIALYSFVALLVVAAALVPFIRRRVPPAAASGA